MQPGWSPTSRRCCTTTPSCCATTSTRSRPQAPRCSARRRSASSATSRRISWTRPRAASTPARTPTSRCTTTATTTPGPRRRPPPRCRPRSCRWRARRTTSTGRARCPTIRGGTCCSSTRTRMSSPRCSAGPPTRSASCSRPAPFVDRTVYAGWSGMMISALFEAARGLGLPDAREAALRGAERLLRDAYHPGRGFQHVAGARDSVSGLLDDQVHMARALLDAFEHTGEPRYLRLAAETMEYVLAEFTTPAGAFYDVARSAAREAGVPGLGVPYVPVQDAPTPSGNGVAVMVLGRLAALTGETRYREAAERALRACAPGALSQGLFAATLALALDLHLDPPLHVVVIGARADPRTRRLHGTALGTYRPGTIVHLYDPSAADGAERGGVLPAPVAAAGGPAGDEPRAYACTATACAAPATDPEVLRDTIRTFGRISAA